MLQKQYVRFMAMFMMILPALWLTLQTSRTISASANVEPELLVIYALAFDGLEDSPNSLSPYITPTIDDLVEASIGAPERAAIVLADGTGSDNTNIFIIRDGEVEVVDGLPDPETPGVLDLMLHEYDMTDGASLGSFLLWARTQYPTVTQTTFSYVGHGTFLMPETDLANLQSPEGTTRSVPGLPSLPSHWMSSPNYTDHTPDAIVSPYDLAQALEIGTDDGANPIQLLDLTHCFSASIEEFYELSNPDDYDLGSGNTQPYAEVMVGAANYVYFAPTMPADALASFGLTDSPAVLAETLISAYDSILAEADASDDETDDGDPVEHPRILTAVDATQIPRLKLALDEIAYWLVQPQYWDRNALLESYQLASKYDTDYCTQDGKLASPDALVDLGSFLESLRTNYVGQATVVANKSQSARMLLDAAVVARKATSGTPWQIDGAEHWEMDGVGISQFMPLVKSNYPNNQAMLPFQYAFYNDTYDALLNPSPYLFVQNGLLGTTWSDVLAKFWEGQTVETGSCIVPLPIPQQDGSIAITQHVEPFDGDVTVDTPLPQSAIVNVVGEVFNSSLVVTVTNSSGEDLITQTIQTGYLSEGSHFFEFSDLLVLPNTMAGQNITMTMMADALNVIAEEDEDNNTLSKVHLATPKFLTRPVMTATISQTTFLATKSIPLAVTISDDASWSVRADVYQFDEMGSSHFLGFVDLDDGDTDLDLSDLSLQPGRIAVHLWGFTNQGQARRRVNLLLNYAPAERQPLAADQRDDYLWEAKEGETLTFRLDTDSPDDVELCVEAPNNHWTQICNSEAVQVANAHEGRYRVAVFANGRDVNYRLITESTPSRSIETATLRYRPLPMFQEPIPCAPSLGCGATSAVTVGAYQVASNNYIIGLVMIVMLGMLTIAIIKRTKRLA
ncbi:MAG: hypothetical protein ACPG8W_17480 [Candidatus Promineifilaceae bacterium]